MNERISRRLLVAGAVATAGAGGIAKIGITSASDVFQAPDTPFGRQLTWVLSVLIGKATGLSANDVTQHFAPSLLAQVPAASLIAGLDQASTQLGPLTPIDFVGTPTETSGVVAIETRSGDHLELILVVSPAPESLITILTYRSAAANATPIASPAAGQTSPDSPVGRQLAWLLGLLSGAPVQLSDVDFAAHFDAGYLKQAGQSNLIDTFNQLSIGDGPFTLDSFVDPPTETEAKAILAGAQGVKYLVSLEIGPAPKSLIVGLLINVAPDADSFASWDEFEAEWRSLATFASFVVVEVAEPVNTLVAGVHETMPLAIGSAFKLYVLGTLATAIEAGVLTWDDKLAIRDDWKSLPSGDFQNEPAGTEFTLRQFAEKMISISDNTAADHLLWRLGRENVETTTANMGIANPTANLPFLTTREIFALKLAADEATVKSYLDARGYGRLVMLAAMDVLPIDISTVASWTGPRNIEQIEWFASVNDLANAMGWLLSKSAEATLGPVRDILGINPGIQFDAKTWQYAGFKGGSEPGVLTLTWFLTSVDQRSFIVSGALNDLSTAIDERTAITTLAKGINLLAKTA